MENKMGTMPMKKLLATMSLPIMLSMLIQACYNIVDSMFVARYSQEALAAVSLAFPIQMLIIAVSVGTAVGVNSLLSRRLGEGRMEEVNKAAQHGILLALISAAVFAVFGLSAARAFANLFTTSADIASQAALYIGIVTVFCFGVFVQIVMERIMQATGNAVYNMVMQGIGALVNIILDPIFIFGLHLDVRGAALATILSQGISCIWILRFLTGTHSTLRIRLRNLRPQKKFILPCLALGLAPFIMQFTESALSISFNTSLLKYGGDTAVGAMTILSSVMQFSMLPLQGLSQGAQPIISFNYGAKNIDRVKKAFHLLLRSAACYSTLLWLLCMLVPQIFISIFTSDADLASYTIWALRIYMAASLLFAVQLACQQTFIALGNAKTSVFLALLRKVLLLIPLIFILPHFVSNPVFGVFVAEPVADTIAVATTAALFFREYKKLG